MKKYTLLTGATGFIGQYVLRRLLAKDVPVVCIARAKGDMTAADRVMELVKQFETAEGRELPKPIVFTGDITQEMLGLDDNALDWFEANCKAVIHNAASIRFHAPDNDRTKDPYLSNVNGTQHMLDLCKFAEIEQVFHVSTAYITGLREGVCLETELDEKQDFANDYQRSKFEAEQMTRGAEHIKSITVIRPGIVVGDSRDGSTTAPDFGLYHYIQFTTQVMKMARSGGAEGTVKLNIRLPFVGTEPRNLITVDWVADAMTHIITTPELHGNTYHLTPSEATTSSRIVEAMGKYFDYEGIVCVGETIPEEDRTEFEKLFFDYATQFEVFWGDEPTFDKTNTNAALADKIPQPPLDDECLRKIIRFAVEECFS